jgi:integrase
MLAETGPPPIRRHDPRHVAASPASEAGADLKVIQDRFGHCPIVTSACTYVSILPDHARKAAEETAILITRAGRRPPGGDERSARSSPPASAPAG